MHFWKLTNAQQDLLSLLISVQSVDAMLNFCGFSFVAGMERKYRREKSICLSLLNYGCL
jgi:hypothetical protein